MKTLSWDKIQQGDEEAFRQLYDQYADLLYGYGMKIAGDDTVVTEAIQSLFVYIFEKRETCAAPQSIPAYLCVSLRHMIVNELKRENSGTFKSLDEVDTNEYRFDLEIDIETAIIRSELEKEQLEALQKELNGLTKQQREVLYLKYYKKMSPEEIAQVMGLTPRTVYNTTHMAITRLRERLGTSLLLAVMANLWIFN
ncbi:RNA polymerase sigma factor [Bacteroides faecium]|uniref:Sigma-70 family RNA polymerase sigma factor n=1 Tax=Bacteroides faecium TaxID=2715212 RepID=A0A6H0KU02_9BACE|nr:sigma-70 family RNA polymerase sigma factor [Bacteroides faecium]QIU96944.1 sigma-70 family RNA polymerase sigma factor [Bacteroides faecium]